ncbi:MAG: type II toxin-antitoxin system PemK/MazF family toxin [Sporichthyaceae bacterium]
MRGSVYRYRPGRDVKGHEQHGPRLALVVQGDALRALSTWVVAPCSASAGPGPTRVEVHVDGVDTRVLVEQIRAVDVSARLGEVVGHLGLTEMQAVDVALLRVLGLD